MINYLSIIITPDDKVMVKRINKTEVCVLDNLKPILKFLGDVAYNKIDIEKVREAALYYITNLYENVQEAQDD